MTPKANQPTPEMYTAFCIHWAGDRKAKHCRTCATENSACDLLWNSVKLLAQQKFVLLNPKNSNRYQLEPPKRSPKLIYIQTLQDKYAHFALPIEDFLYVAKTGRGAMYETPSQTKQQPFVGLILEHIAKTTSGAELIRAVREIPQKPE